MDAILALWRQLSNCCYVNTFFVHYILEYHMCHVIFLFSCIICEVTSFSDKNVYLPSISGRIFYLCLQDSNQFEIVEQIAERRVLPSNEEEPNYAVLTYTLRLRRNVVFASYILTLPCVFLACLTLVVFWLPPDRPDRTALGK